ncbi:LytR/AlgR family response regulator transcription factor [Akkermansia muciniphila]|nr:LytTR family DNA-binding domain-containing protein [Akkermansia muciniphila]
MVFVKMNDGFQRILMKHILYVEAGGSYCTLHVHGMPAILVSAPLARVSEHLDGEYFIRVHRSYLVNKLHIESIAGNFLQVGVVAIPISKFMKKKVLGSLNMLSFSK